MSFYNKFTGINNLPENSRGAMRRFGAIRVSVAAVYNYTSTIFILHIIGNIGFADASMIIAIMFLAQLLVDYPSGSLGDLIGQRWVLGIAYTLAGIATIIFSMATSFNMFLIAAVIFGLANAQISGALQAWIDNGYKQDDDHDPERKNYGYTINRLNSIDSFAMGIAILVGGFIATVKSREFAFQLQAVLLFGLAILVVSLLNIDKNEEKKSENTKGYFSILKEGIGYVLASKKELFFILGNSIIMTVWIIWGNLMLFPIYFGYTGSDALAGTLRSTIFFIGVIIQIVMSKYTKRMKFKHLPRAIMGHFTLLFLGMITLQIIRPLDNTYTLQGFIAVILIMTISVSLFMPFLGTLMRRIMLDLIPSEYRNSIYSLMPTISGVMSFFLLPVLGGVISQSGLINALLIILGVAVVGTSSIALSIFFMNPVNTIKLSWIRKITPSKS